VAQWDPTITQKTCIDFRAAFLAAAALNSFSDFLVFLWPARALWNIQLPVKQRVGLILVFAVGCMCVFLPTPLVMSIARICCTPQKIQVPTAIGTCYVQADNQKNSSLGAKANGSCAVYVWQASVVCGTSRLTLILTTLTVSLLTHTTIPPTRATHPSPMPNPPLPLTDASSTGEAAILWPVTSTEIDIGIVCGCLPGTKPLLSRLFPRLFSTS